MQTETLPPAIEKYVLWISLKRPATGATFEHLDCRSKSIASTNLKAIKKLDTTNMHWIFKGIALIHVFQCFHFYILPFFRKRQYFSFLEERCLFIQVYIFCMFTSFCIVSIFYLSLFLFIYLFVYLCFFIWWFVLRKSIFPYFRGNSLNSREGGVVSAKMFAFLTFHFCKRYQTLFFPEPNIVASATKATTVHSQQLSQCPT